MLGEREDHQTLSCPAAAPPVAARPHQAASLLCARPAGCITRAPIGMQCRADSLPVPSACPLRWLMLKAGLGGSSLMPLVNIAFMLVFFGCRNVWGPSECDMLRPTAGAPRPPLCSAATDCWCSLARAEC